MMMYGVPFEEDEEYSKWYNSFPQRFSRRMRSMFVVDYIGVIMNAGIRAWFRVGWYHSAPVVSFGVSKGRSNDFSSTIFAFSYTCNFREVQALSKTFLYTSEDCSHCDKERLNMVRAQKRVLADYIYKQTGKVAVFDDEETPPEEPALVGAKPDKPDAPRDGAMLEWP